MPSTVEPPIARLKKDEQWQRSSVESTVRQWFPYMAVNSSELTRVQKEWSSYFELPPDMQGDQVRDEDRLVWQPLPKHIPQVFTAEHTSFLSPSVRLENPSIDPTFGFGRSAKAREKEMEEYRALIREESAAAGTAPIF